MTFTKLTASNIIKNYRHSHSMAKILQLQDDEILIQTNIDEYPTTVDVSTLLGIVYIQELAQRYAIELLYTENVSLRSRITKALSQSLFRHLVLHNEIRVIQIASNTEVLDRELQTIYMDEHVLDNNLIGIMTNHLLKSRYFRFAQASNTRLASGIMTRCLEYILES